MKNTINTWHEIKKGDTLIIEKEVMFKGKQQIKLKVVGVTDQRILLEDGSTIWKTSKIINQ